MSDFKESGKYLFNFHLHHLFAREVYKFKPRADFLNEMGITLDMWGNKIALFSSSSTADAFRAVPWLKDLLAKIGFGLDDHYAHPGYNKFLTDAIDEIRADTSLEPDQQKLAVFDLRRFVKDIAERRIDGLTVVGGLAHADTLLEAWEGRKLNIKALSPDAQAAELETLVKDADPTLVDAGLKTNFDARYVLSKSLGELAFTAGIIDSERHAQFLENLALAGTSDGRTFEQNKATSAATIKLIGDIKKGLGQPLTTREQVEVLGADLAIVLAKFGADESGNLNLDAMIASVESVFAKLAQYKDSFLASLDDFGRGIVGQAATSVNALLVGLGGSVIGDIVEFMNAAYEPIKKGFQTGDWSDLGEVVVQYGVAAVISAILVTASIVVTGAVVTAIAGAPAAAIATTFVAAGWAAKGLYDAVQEGSELLDKIQADLADVIPKIGRTIEEIQERADVLARAVNTIFGIIENDFEPPQFAQPDGLARVYVVDPLDRAQPDAIEGSEGAERFYGRNSAAIDAGAGNDEIIFKNGFGEGRGGAGDDILIAGRSRYVRKGERLDPADPNSELADRDMRMVLDGGEGDDWVIALGGTGAITRGGLGRDFVFNTSAYGELFGDSVDGQGKSDGRASASGKTDSDVFWYWPGTFIMDARPNDILQFFGVPMLGGTNSVAGVYAGDGALAMDWLMPFVFYGYSEGGQLLIYNALMANVGPEDMKGIMVVENYTFGGWKDAEWGRPAPGDLGMTFRIAGEGEGAVELSRWNAVWGHLFTKIDVLWNLTKAIRWQPVDDPLVLDLDGDGIETVSKLQSGVYYDLDGDYFAERTGWLSGDDGFVVLDRNGNGRIDDISEMFGGPGRSGLAQLAEFDTNSDGLVTAADARFGELRVWRDLDGDGVTDAGELFTLDALGIVSLGVAGAALDIETPQGNRLLARGEFTRADGTTGAMYDMAFDTDPTDTIFRGERGVAEWLTGGVPDAKGFGAMTSLAVGQSNDFELAEIVAAAAANATSPVLKDIRAAITPVFGAWAQSLELTREIVPVLLSQGPDGATLIDRAVWVEDAAGGWWTLHSGAPVLDAQGAEIARPTLADVLAQDAGDGSAWRLEQMFSPSSRAAALEHRAEAPYLAKVVDGRVVVLDHGIENADGTWRLASGREIVDAQGAPIAQPGVADIRALAVGEGEEWRVEALGHNPYADLAVDRMAVYIVDGRVVDYSVQVTDADGNFDVWARNLDRALELQHKLGRPGEFQLRNYALDFETLPEVQATEDSAYRVEILTAGQFHFATSAYGIDFQPEMMAARIDPLTKRIDYSVGSWNGDALSDTNEDGSYRSAIAPTIDLMEVVVDNYITVSRAFAVRVALQGGLKDYARGLGYDAEADKFFATTDRELAPMLEAIFERAPQGYEATFDYLAAWDEILEIIYPDYRIDGSANFVSGAMRVDEKFLAQMIVAAFENVAIDIDLAAAFNVLGVDETKLIRGEADASAVAGTNGVDFIYVTGAGSQVYNGGRQADVYIVGKGFGEDVIADVDDPVMRGEKADEIRFAQAKSTDIRATRDGQDLVLEVIGTDDVLRVRDQFLGDRIDPLFGYNFSPATQISAIIFADGVIWDRLGIAQAVSHPLDTNDAVIGSQSRDWLEGGKGNDVVKGGRDGDIYIFREGDGDDRFFDDNDWWADRGQDKYDFIQFGEGLSADRIKFHRAGESDDVEITFLDEAGAWTGDRVTIEGQFFWANAPFLGLMFPYRIESIGFADGGYLQYTDVMARVLQDMKTDGADVIYGFNNRDVLDGGKGDDLLVGRAQDDTYIYGRDYGRDVIHDQDDDFFAPSYDVLIFKDGLVWTDFVFERDGASPTVALRVEGTQDSVILKDSYKAAPFLGFNNMIEELRFADGTVWDATKLAQHYINLARTDGDDTIYGFDIANTHDGGAGDDRIEGMGGDDTYIYARGYGNDTIFDTSSDEAGDTLILEGIALDDVEFGRAGENLILRIRDTGERLTLERQYSRDGAQGNAIETFVFSDITVDFTHLNPEDIDLVGTSADEILIGTNFGEVIDGRGGDDILIGGSDGDSYRFDVGYGNEVIIDRQVRAAWTGRDLRPEKEKDDRILFGDDITIENAVFTKDGDDLLISITDRVDTLRIRNQFRDIEDQIEWFEFKDGTRWHASDIEERLAIVGGSRGDDRIEGILDNPNVLDGRQGDDELIGGRAGDTYAFGAQYDLDTIIEREDGFVGAIDRVVFGSTVARDTLELRRDSDNLVIGLGNGEDQLTIVQGFTTRQVEEFLFADGSLLTLEDIRDLVLTGTPDDDVLIGFDDRDDVLDGGAGSDALEGGLGNDSYRFGIGSGDDSIRDTGGVDAVLFGRGVTGEMLRFQDENGDLLLRLHGSDDTLIIFGGSRNDVTSGRVERFVFDDGSEIGIADVLQKLVRAKATSGQDVIDARIGSPVTVEGGAGDDLVILGNDGVALFKAGDGLDVLDTLSATGSTRLVFTDLSSSDAEVRRADLDGADLIIAFPRSGDQVLVRGAMTSSRTPQVEFADGVIWQRTDLVAAAVAAQSTERSDAITGSSLDDLIRGGAGDDDIQGGAGNDVYRYERGDGRDVISDVSGTDRLDIRGYRPDEATISRPVADRQEILLGFVGTNDQILLRFGNSGTAGVETITFGDGTVWSRQALFDKAVGQGTDYDDVLVGTASANTMIGGAGNDRLSGGDGSDTYIYGRGDGRDIIADGGRAGDYNKLVIRDYAPADVTVVRAEDRPNDLVLRFSGTDEIVVVGGFVQNGRHISSFTFEDGSVWSLADVLFRLEQTRPRDRAETLIGTSGNDVLVGFGGDDYLSGRNGADTYIFRRGDGRDVIEDFGQTDGTILDMLRIDGFTPEETRFERSITNASDIVIRFPGTLDQITIVGGIDDARNRIERIVFDNGPTFTHAEILALVLQTGTEADDDIQGTSAGEILSGGMGSDTISGQDGADTYIYRRGDGQDTIRDNGWAGADVILIEGYSPEETRLSRSMLASDTLIITFDGTQDKLTVVNTLDSDSRDQIEQIRFTDGTTWTISQVKAMLVAAQQSDGDDRVVGFDTADTIVGGPGNDSLYVGDGSDNYVFKRGDGRDFIADNGYFDTDVVTISGYTDEEIVFSIDNAIPDRLVITFIGTDDRITIHNTLDSDDWDQIEQVRLADGSSTWTIGQIKQMLVAAQATDGNDRITGFDSADAINGGTGNDYLRGGDGSDAYHFARGDGRDFIEDNGWHDTDVVTISGYSEEEIVFSGDPAIPDRLVITFVGTDDRITIHNTLDGDTYDQIEQIRLADGSKTWTIGQIKQLLVEAQATDGDDRITGFDSADIINGGLGDDHLAGGDGSDTYIFARGDGRDFIDDNGWHDTDVVTISGYAEEEIIFSRDTVIPDRLVITFVGTDDSITIRNTLDGDAWDQIEQIRLADGSRTWSIAQVIAALTAAPARVSINGTNVNDTLDATAAPETLIGYGGNDTYVYTRGDGDDIIEDTATFGGANDVLILHDIAVADVRLDRIGGDVSLHIAESAPGAGDGGRILLRQTLNPYFERGVETIRFDDGTEWRQADLRAMIVAGQTSDGDDEIYGTDANDTIVGGKGDDLLVGYRGDDTYIYSRGDGQDIIDESETFGGKNDVLILHGIAGEDVWLGRIGGDVFLHIAESAPGAGDGGRIVLRQTLNPYFERGVERIRFDDGTEWTQATLREMIVVGYASDGDDIVYGTTGNDVIVGGPGNDRLVGYDGNDTYVYTRGDGDDVVDDSDTHGGSNDVLILHDIAVADVRLDRNGGDVFLHIAESAPFAGDGGRIVLRQTLNPYFERGVEAIRFDDGTEWTQADLRQMIVAGYTTDGDDVAYGTTGNDTITGGHGNDLLVGYDGDDTYVYSRGDGDDVIDDTGTHGGANDTLVFADILPSEVSARKSGNHIILTIRETSPGAGDGGEIVLLESATTYYERGMERISFADGTVWVLSNIIEVLLASSQTDGNDRVVGTAAGDLLTAGLGNDVINGLDGSDTYVFRRGDGKDIIHDKGFRDLDTLQLVGYAPDELILSRQFHPAGTLLIQFAGTDDSVTIVNTLTDNAQDQIEQFVFDDGTVWTLADIRARLVAQQQSTGDDYIIGFDGADTLQAGAGNDIMAGGQGLDTYVYARGDGNDIIRETTAESGDVLRLTGITPQEVVLTRGVGEDLEIVVRPTNPGGGDGGRVTVRGSFLATNTTGIESIIFDDGTQWSRAEFEALAERNVASGGNDVLTGTSGNDTLEGLAGADAMTGGLGDDVFVFRRGDGQDTIRDVGGGFDRIEISGYALDEVSFARRGRDAPDLIIRFAGTDDSITVINGLLPGSADRIEEILLTDSGTILPIDVVLSSLVLGAPSDGNDQIIGTALSDTIDGGRGDDLLVGLGGDDTYVWSRSDGDDRIVDGATSSRDVLRLIDVASTDALHATRSPANGLDLVLRFDTGRDRIVLADSLGDNYRGVEEVHFSDGVIWGLPEMRAAVLASAVSDGDETIRGFSQADTLHGAGGDDTLIGDGGADTYVYRAGDGHDVIDDQSNSAGDRLLIENLVSSEASVKRLYKGSDSVVISFATAAGSVTLRDVLSPTGGGVEQIVFSDGVTWTRETILELLANNAPVAVKDGILAARQDQVLLIDPATLLRNDYDADGDTLRVISVNGGDKGTAEIDANGIIAFRANPGYFGSAQMTYVVSDGRNGIATGTVDIRVSPLAVARDDAGFAVEEDGFLTIEARRLLSNDADGDRMIVAQVKDAVGGRASLASNGEISFTPAPDYNGPASFTYVANTPEGGRAEAVVRIDVTAVNDAPVARPDSSFETLEGQSFVIGKAALLANDSDVDGDRLSISAVFGNADVEAFITETGDILVLPRAYFFGTSSIAYEITDPSGLTSTSTVQVQVVPVNDAPMTQPDAFIIDEDHPILLPAVDLLGNDSDPDGDLLTIASVRFGFGGSVQLYDNQTILFTPWQDHFGQAWFRYTASDGQGGFTEQRVDIQVNPVNDAPVARDESYADDAGAYLRGVEDAALDIPFAELLKNDYDVDSLTLRLDTISYSENGQAEILDNGVVRFTPEPDYWGVASFRYVVSDAEGRVDDALVTLYFDPVADGPPVAGDDIVHVYEDVPTIIPRDVLLANDIDIDRDPLMITSISRDLSGHGTVAFTDTGDILFTPALNSTMMSALTYTVSDGVDGEDTGRVQIMMIPVNDAPTAMPDFGSTTLDAPLVLRISDLMANDSDVDLDQRDYDLLQFVGVRSTTHGIASIYGGEFVVVDYARGFSGATSLEYIIRDPEGVEDDGTVTVAVVEEAAAVIRGSEQRDLLIGSFRGERIEGGAGNDDIFGREGDDIIDGGDGADRIDGGAGFDTVEFTGSNIGVRADIAARIGQGGHAQGDVYINIEALTGSEFADELGGDDQDNVLKGMGGSDLLIGRGGDDRLEGGDGDDRLIGGEGADTLDGGEGRDTADYSTSGAGVLVSLATGLAMGGDAEGDILISIENLVGSDFDDHLTGDDVDNILIGGRGDDVLIGEAGNDTLIGGRGADTLIGGEGIDRADYSQSAEGVIVNMLDSSAGGGDAEGDTFHSIEIIVGSFHDDTIIGDDGDNIIMGGCGADFIDGGAGFDTADYSQADEAVIVDLGLGQGLSGEAEGDTLVNIERLVGSAYSDILRGGAGDDVFVGGFGNDTLEGRAGSDTYHFGYDSGEDLVVEAGNEGDVDRIVMAENVRPADVSIIREGDDLLIELERDDGLLIDTLRVRDHFLSAQAGIEEIVFANGTAWNRDQIDALVRDGRFNAQDDVIRFATEDESYRIEAVRLLANDAENIDGLTIVAVENAVDGSVSLNADGSVQFIGAPDHNGDAFFDYIVQDAFGRESRARAEVNILPVNDAPEAGDDGIFTGVEDTDLFIPLADLLANDIDVDGDQLMIVGVGPLYGEDGAPLYHSLPGNASNGLALNSGSGVTFRPTHNHYGFAGFTYTIADPEGLTSTASVTLNFLGVNDAPDAYRDNLTARLGRTFSFQVDQLLANDSDPENDAFSFTRIVSLDKGVYTLRDENGIRYIDFEGAELGEATLVYEVTDSHGASSQGEAVIRVVPLNDPPNARNDWGFTTLEDTLLIIDPATLLLNDSDPNGDPLVVSSLARFPDNGKVAFDEDGMIVFTPKLDFNGQAGFEYTISDGQGGFDTAYVSITVQIDNDGPVLRDDTLDAREDHPIVVLAAEAFANDMDPEGDFITFHDARFLGVLTDDFSNRSGHRESVALASPLLAFTTGVVASLANGDPLPDWLGFDAHALVFHGTPPIDVTEPLDLRLTFTASNPETGEIAVWENGFTLDPANPALAAEGFAYDPGLIALPVARNGAVTALLASGRDLPQWLAFDAQTGLFSKTGVAPLADESHARVRVNFTPDDPGIESFAVEVVIDPHRPIDPAIQTIFAQPDYFRMHGLFVLPVEAGATVTAAKANGFELPSWLIFDEETFSFTGAPPQSYVGAVEARIDFSASGDWPSYALITDIVIDHGFTLAPLGGFNVTHDAERIRITTPEDFYGAFAIRYDAIDIKGAVSAAPGIIVINVSPERELPDAGEDVFTTVEDKPITFSLATLLANDKDDDGDPIRIIGVGETDKGAISVVTQEIVFDLPPVEGLDPASTTHSATLAGGAELPSWLSIDPATGRISGTPPLSAKLTLAIVVSSTDGVSSALTPVSLDVDGNAGALVTFDPNPEFSGEVVFSYLLTDDSEGAVEGTIRIDVTTANDPPVAVDDIVAAVEDTPLLIDPATLLANDTDVDGDALSLVDVFNAVNGTVELVDGMIVFTPLANFDGVAGFDYTVTDGTDGSDTGHVRVDVESTNRAPGIGIDRFQTLEDTPIIVPVADLLANDSDPDGDALSFVSLQAGEGARAFLLPGGDWQLMPRDNINGELSFSYTITDGRLTTVLQGAIILDVTPVNDAPVVIGESGFVTREDTAIRISLAELLANDSDVEGDPLSIVSVGDPVNGSVMIEGEYALFTPRGDYFGNAGFRYTVSDGEGGFTDGFVAIMVTPEQDLPIAVPDTGWVIDEDSFVLIDPLELLANDYDPDGDPLTFLSAWGAGVTMTPDGLIRFAPGADQYGLFTSSYSIADGSGVPVTGTFAVRVLPIDDAPRAGDDRVEGVEDEPLVIPLALLLDNDRDPDAQDIEITAVTAMSGGSVGLDGVGNVIFTPEADINGDAAFRYTLTDVTGRTDEATVTVRLAAVNDAPVIAPFGPLTGVEDEFIAVQLPSAAFTDIDGDALTLSVRLANGDPLPSWLVYNPVTRSLTGLPPENLNGAIDLVVTASDGQMQASQPFQLILQPVNDAPAIAAIADVHSPEDERLSWQIPEGAINDVEGDALAISVARIGGAALPAWLSFDDATLTLSGTPPENYNGRIALQLTASDGEVSTTRSFDIVVDPVNDAPVLASPFSDRYTPEDEFFDIRLQQGLFSDVDGDALSYSITALDGSPLPGWISINNEALSLQGLPPLDFNGSIDLRVSASDGQTIISDAFKLTVTPVNDAPVVSRPLPDVTSIDGASLKTGASFTIAIAPDTFTDRDGDALQFGARLASGEQLPAWMSFDGTKITGNAPHVAAGSYDIEILATDGQAQSSDVFRIVIEQGNSAPIANLDGTFTVYQPQPIHIAASALLANDTDADGDALAVTAVSSAANGAVTLADGFVTYTPLPGYAGPDEFTYLVSDGYTTSTGTVALNVDASYVGFRQGTSGDDTVFGGIRRGDFFGGAGDDTMLSGLLGGRLAGGTGNDTLIGLIGSVELAGNEGDDRLIGGLRNDRLSGGEGNDVLTGGRGRDTFVFGDGGGSDIITDFNPGRRTRSMFIAGDTIEIDVTGIDDFEQLMAKAQETDDGVLFDFGNGDDLFLMGTLLAALDKDSFTLV